MKRSCSLLLLAALAIPSLALSRDVIACFDFGGAFQQTAVGYTPVSRVYHSPRYVWTHNVREVARIGFPDPLLRDFVELDEAEFWVGLDNGPVDVELICHDPQQAHGPFSIWAQDSLVSESMTIARGDTVHIDFSARASDGRLRLRFQADPGQSFLCNALVLRAEPHTALRPMFPSAPPDILPDTDTVFRHGETDVRQRLQELCDWILDHRLENGFLGDFEPGETTTMFWWYTSAYPLRTLLAASQLLDQPRYLEAAELILDRFVSEQLPNGAWHQTYRNKPTEHLTQAEIDSIMTYHWMNMADIGSTAITLGLACSYVDKIRKQRYIAALEHFCRDWAMQWQLESGGFTNGMESGVAQTEVYGVATALQAANFAVLYSLTGDDEFLRVAERAARFLTDNWNRDGRPIGYAHHGEQVERIYDQPILHFGAAFYYIEGVMTVYHHGQNTELKEKIETVLDWYVRGEKGLLAVMGDRPWWPLQDAWDNSKTAGIPLAVLAVQQQNPDPAVDRAAALTKRFLCTNDFARRIGVMVKDADLPWGSHNLQTWAALSMSATGFAGLSLVEMLQPGLVYGKQR
ncbi:hypothetical protein JW992_01690 [candidate division KSB1 bacterium]|nr:hypothetical protein [candidate division KSB1 bacterium]